MRPFVLYCKSYHTDVKRVARLARSVQQYNVDRIPFYVSVPESDLPLFREYLQGLEVELITDESIIDCNPAIDKQKLAAIPGSLSQQVVKSEFWRLGLSEAYLCLDSDSSFIRPFKTAEFMAPNGVPYTVITEAHELQFDSLSRGKNAVINNFQREAAQVQRIFGRKGKAYSFGPMPMVWHSAVWEALASKYLIPQGMNFMNAIELAPLESRWYGEALLRFKPVELLPCEPFFKVYHYAWQLDKDRRRQIGSDQLAQLYSGVIYQSSWERSMDWPSEGGNHLSRTGRRIRRALGRI